jgi:acyl carrier protein
MLSVARKGVIVAEDATFEKFKACAVQVLQVPAEKVVLEARFGDDLNADSLDLVEFVMALEEAFDITVDETELEGVETVGQAYELVTTKT